MLDELRRGRSGRWRGRVARIVASARRSATDIEPGARGTSSQSTKLARRPAPATDVRLVRDAAVQRSVPTHVATAPWRWLGVGPFELAGEVGDARRASGCRPGGRAAGPGRRPARRRRSPRSGRRPCAAASSCLPSFRGAELGAERRGPRPRSSVAIRSRSAVAAGSAPTTTATRRRSAGGGVALRLEREQHPIEPEPEPDPGRRPAAEQLDEPVVAAAAAERRLLARARRRDRTRTRSACSSRGRGRAAARAGTRRPSASRCARTPAKCSAQASHRRSVIVGAPAFSSTIAGSFESSRRSGLRSRRSRSSGGSRSTCAAVVRRRAPRCRPAGTPRRRSS